jgi:hypothetical protein
MRTAVRSLTVGLAVLLSAVPVVLIAVLTWNAIEGLISMPHGFVGWASFYCLWWVGFGGVLVFARRLSRRSSTPWRQVSLMTLLLAGVVAVGWLEVQSWQDPKHLFPPSFFAVPYVVTIVAGLVARMLSNSTVETDAQQAARGSL